jgi:hypothetical protein
VGEAKVRTRTSCCMRCLKEPGNLSVKSSAALAIRQGEGAPER